MDLGFIVTLTSIALLAIGLMHWMGTSIKEMTCIGTVYAPTDTKACYSIFLKTEYHNGTVERDHYDGAIIDGELLWRKRNVETYLHPSDKRARYMSWFVQRFFTDRKAS